SGGRVAILAAGALLLSNLTERGATPIATRVRAVAGVGHERLVLGGDDGTLVLCDIGTSSIATADLGRLPVGVLSITGLPDGRIASWHADGLLRAWHTDRPGAPVAAFKERLRPPVAIGMLDDGRIAVASGREP